MKKGPYSLWCGASLLGLCRLVWEGAAQNTRTVLMAELLANMAHDYELLKNKNRMYELLLLVAINVL